MKKLILAVITIITAVAIFGCGKTASSTGGGGGGGSSGGGGGTPRPRTFSVQGHIDNSGDVNIQSLDTEYEVSIYSFKEEIDLSGVECEYYALNNTYKITGIPLGAVYVIEAVREDSVTLSALVWGAAAGENKTVNLTPVSTVIATVISDDPVVQDSLAVSGVNATLSGILENIQEDIENYYESNPTATTNVNALPPAVTGIVSDLVNTNKRTLAVTVSPAGTGTVSPNGGVYLKGTVLSLTAEPAGGYEFDNWSTGGNNPLEITLNDNTSVIANFDVVSNYTAPNSFSVQGTIASDENGGFGAMALTEQYKIRIKSFDNDNLDFVKIKLRGDNTYTISNLPLANVYVVEATRGGTARLSNLVYGVQELDGMTETVNLTPTSTVLVQLLEEFMQTVDEDDFLGLSAVNELRDEIDTYYAAHPAELNTIIAKIKNGGITRDDLPVALKDAADEALPILQVPEIPDLANWAYDSSGDRDGKFHKNNYPQPPDLADGGLLEGMQLGQKDGKLYFILKLNGTPNPALRYQVNSCYGNKADNYHMSVQENGRNEDNSIKWQFVCWPSGGPSFVIDPDDIYLEIRDNLIIAGGAPLTQITEYLGTAPYYRSYAGVALKDGHNYYDIDLGVVSF
ncbi:MAG: hypothetical protein LBQ83_06390 [Candidatus Margulisbacteria bacterium]|jgi:hypothetical protein|nr:hypothetical protein [Candidatus Margulisiibacteriota bacterium]